MIFVSFIFVYVVLVLYFPNHLLFQGFPCFCSCFCRVRCFPCFCFRFRVVSIVVYLLMLSAITEVEGGYILYGISMLHWVATSRALPDKRAPLSDGRIPRASQVRRSNAPRLFPPERWGQSETSSRMMRHQQTALSWIFATRYMCFCSSARGARSGFCASFGGISSTGPFESNSALAQTCSKPTIIWDTI